ncbi:unnamed protein product, partial [Staurois parvus]
MVGMDLEQAGTRSRPPGTPSCSRRPLAGAGCNGSRLGDPEDKPKLGQAEDKQGQERSRGWYTETLNRILGRTLGSTDNKRCSGNVGQTEHVLNRQADKEAGQE